MTPRNGRLPLAILVLALLAGAASGGCAAPTSRKAGGAGDPLPPELSRVLCDYEAAWRAKDAAALAALFAEDGFVLPNGALPVRGREAIAAHYAGAGGPLALRSLAWDACGGVAYVIGGYASTPGEPDAGKFTLTLRRGPDGRWLIVSDMDSPNRRPPPR